METSAILGSEGDRVTIPTMQESVDAAVAALEARLGMDVPLYEKSFLNALAVVLGMNNAQLYRFGEQRAKQVLTLTARGADLEQLGREYGVVRKPAVKAVMEGFCWSNVGETGYIYQSDALTIGDTGLLYFPIQDYIFPPNTTDYIQFRAELAGAEPTLYQTSPTTVINWVTYPEGIASDVGITDTIVYGSDEETDDELRLRILTEIQTVGGGSNEADYRRWGMLTPNVLLVDPYTGTEPWTSQAVPGWRTVYVEATTSYHADGIADTALLDLTRDYITYDQDTGIRNLCLGSTDDTLEMRSITRYPAYFRIHDLSVDAARTLDCQNDITSTLDSLCRNMRPFILGLDTEAFANNVLSSSVAARQVQRVVQAYGGSVGLVQATIDPLDYDAPPYPLEPGERLKAVVSYV